MSEPKKRGRPRRVPAPRAGAKDAGKLPPKDLAPFEGLTVEYTLANIFDLASRGATQHDAARIFGIPPRTFESRLGSVTEDDTETQDRKAWELGRAQFRQELRDLQLVAARRGNTVMLIWLGKNELDQSDQPKKGGNEIQDTARAVFDIVTAMRGALNPAPENVGPDK